MVRWIHVPKFRGKFVICVYVVIHIPLLSLLFFTNYDIFLEEKVLYISTFNCMCVCVCFSLLFFFFKQGFITFHFFMYRQHWLPKLYREHITWKKVQRRREHLNNLCVASFQQKNPKTFISPNMGCYLSEQTHGL